MGSGVIAWNCNIALWQNSGVTCDFPSPRIKISASIVEYLFNETNLDWGGSNYQIIQIMEQTVLYTNLTAKSCLKLIIRISCAENDKYVVILNSLNIYI